MISLRHKQFLWSVLLTLAFCTACSQAVATPQPVTPEAIKTPSLSAQAFSPTQTVTSTQIPFPEGTATPGYPIDIQLSNGGWAEIDLIIDRQQTGGRSIATAFWSPDEQQIIYALAVEADSLDFDWYAYDPRKGTIGALQEEPIHLRHYATVTDPYPTGAVSPSGRYVLEYIDTSPPTPTPALLGPRERRFDLWLLDTQTQERTHILENQLGFPFDVQWSQDELHFLVSTGGEGTSRHYIVQRGQEPSHHFGQEGDVLLSPDGQWAAVGNPYGPNGMRIFSTRSDLALKLQMNSNELRWTPDSRHLFFLSPVDDYSIGDLWRFDLESEDLVVALPGEDIEQLSFCYRLTCNYAISSSLDQVLFWTTGGAWLASSSGQNGVNE